MSADDRRLIEDYLPIQAISAEASREKRHISGLHLWWARRPLLACRAAVYGALVPVSRFQPGNGPEEKRGSLGRANAAKFVERLCKYPGDALVIAEAQQHILEAHAERLSAERGESVTVDDILQGCAPRPKVLDMFAGGGAIPLEALRLGCEAYALDLNPVAHIIELCTLVYPQKYGKPDSTAKGSAKDGTWAGLAEEVRYWGQWVLKKVKAEIGDLYPPIPDPKAPKTRHVFGEPQLEMSGRGFEQLGQQRLTIETPTGYLTPVAYLWTRTVRCKNPSCGATVPLVRQTWLCKKTGRYAALKMITPKSEKHVLFKVVEADSERGLGFDPAGFSKGGNATCPFCGTVADSNYVKAESCAKRMSQRMMAVACTRPGTSGKIYVSADEQLDFVPDDETIRKQIDVLCARTGLTVPNEPIEANPRSMDTQHFGFQSWSELFTPRQIFCLLTFTAALHEAVEEMRRLGYDREQGKAVASFLACVVDKTSDYSSTLCAWHYNNEQVGHTFGRQALPMVWDFVETNILMGASGSWSGMLESSAATISPCSESSHRAAIVSRGSATTLP